jgi:hypothetical protein
VSGWAHVLHAIFKPWKTVHLHVPVVSASTPTNLGASAGCSDGQDVKRPTTVGGDNGNVVDTVVNDDDDDDDDGDSVEGNTAGLPSVLTVEGPPAVVTAFNGDRVYAVQHASLFVTSFVLLMGLLFKVEGVSSASPTYYALSYVMVVFCVLFIVFWAFSVLMEMLARRHKTLAVQVCAGH